MRQKLFCGWGICWQLGHEASSNIFQNFNLQQKIVTDRAGAGALTVAAILTGRSRVKIERLHNTACSISTVPYQPVPVPVHVMKNRVE